MGQVSEQGHTILDQRAVVHHGPQAVRIQGDRRLPQIGPWPAGAVQLDSVAGYAVHVELPTGNYIGGIERQARIVQWLYRGKARPRGREHRLCAEGEAKETPLTKHAPARI